MRKKYFASETTVNKNALLTLVLCALYWCAMTPVTAQSVDTNEEIVITATRTALPIEQIGSSVTVFTAEDIARLQTPRVADLLRTAPGIEVDRTGSFGGLTNVRLRGSEANQVLVLIDGIEVSDPSAFGGAAFDFANLMTADIARIEIVRGPQSTLYGADAMGGVINIITERGVGKPRLFLVGEGGSFQTGRGEASLRGESGIFDYRLSAAGFKTAGISAADADNGNPEKDSHRNVTLSSQIGMSLGDNVEIIGRIRYVDTRTESDPQPFDFTTFLSLPPQDGDDVSQNEQLEAAVSVQLDLFDNRFKNTLTGAFTNSDNDFFESGTRTFFSRGERLKFGYHGVFQVDQKNTLSFGAETEEEEVETAFFVNEELRINGFYGQLHTTIIEHLSLTAGVRYDKQNDFSGKTTYRFTGAYHLPDSATTLRASVGTGFKPPALSELFGLFGNPDLKPEKNIGWDISIEQYFAEGKLRAQIGYFDTDFENLILFGPTFLPENIGDASSRGVEASIEIRPVPEAALSLAYTFIEAEDDATGLQLLRRPKHDINISLELRPLPKLSTVLSVNYVSSRVDLDFTKPAGDQRTRLDGYVVVDLNFGYRINDNVEIFGRIENLFDETYQEVLGFGTPGIAAFSGLRVNL